MSETTEQCRRCEAELKELETQYNNLKREASQLKAEYDRASSAHGAAVEGVKQADHRRNFHRGKLKTAVNLLRNAKSSAGKSRQNVFKYRDCVQDIDYCSWCDESQEAYMKSKLRGFIADQQKAENDVSSFERFVGQNESNFSAAQRELENAQREVENVREAYERAKSTMVGIQARKNEVGNLLLRKRNECERACSPW